MPRKGTTTACIHGERTGTPRHYHCPTMAVRCGRRQMWTTSARGRALLEFWTWKETFLNGPMNFVMSTPAPRSFEVGLITSPAVRSGIFRRLIGWTSTKSIC